MDSRAPPNSIATAPCHAKVGVVLVDGALGSSGEPSNEQGCQIVSSTAISIPRSAGDKHQRTRFDVDYVTEVSLRRDGAAATADEPAAVPSRSSSGENPTLSWSAAAGAMRQKILDGVLESLCDGFSATLMSCGAAKTGKTTLLFGVAPQSGVAPLSDGHAVECSPSFRGGVVDGLLSDLVDSTLRLPAYVEQSVTVTAVEISTSAAAGQLERVRDLLDPKCGSAFQDRKLRMYPETGLCVEGVAMGPLATQDDLQSLLRGIALSRGNNSAAAGGRLFPGSPTAVAAGAHLVLQVHVRRKDVHQGVMRRACLTVVDFCGPCPAVGGSSSTTTTTSPTTSQSPSGVKDGFRSVPVSKALSSLHRIVTLLSSTTTAKPAESILRRMARESLVTSLLGDVLVGDGRLFVVSTVSTSSLHVEPSLRTLGFVSQLRKLRLQPKAHEERCDVVVRAIQQEMAHMKSKLLNEASSTRTRHEDLARIQDQLRYKAEILVDEHDRKSQVREDLSKQVDHMTRELDVLQSLVVSKQLAAAEAHRMKHELERITSARASAMQRLHREESLKQQAAERLAEARRLEKEIEQMKEQRLVLEAAARREQTAEAQRVMRTVFATATSIGRDRFNMKQLERRNASLKESIASLTARLKNLDDLITAVDGHANDLDATSRRLEEHLVAMARAKSSVMQSASDTERVLEEESERLMLMTQVSQFDDGDEAMLDDSEDGARSGTLLELSPEGRRSSTEPRSSAADEALIHSLQERVLVLEAQLADTQRERLALEAASLQLQQDLLVRQEEFVRLGGSDGLRSREAMRLDGECDDMQQSISSLECEIGMLERVHRMYDRMEGRCDSGASTQEDSGLRGASAPQHRQQQLLLRQQYEQHQEMLRRGLTAVVDSGDASPGRLSRSFQQQRDAMKQSPSLRRFV